MSHNVRIARSGVQYYVYDELASLGLSTPPREYKDYRVFGVYRPAEVLRKSADLFKGTPLTVGHQHWVTDKTASYVVGQVGDKVSIKVLDGEVVLTSTINFDDESKRPDYSELSPGYVAKNRWAKGVAPDGTPFQIISDEIKEVNHLALVKEARGGKEMRVLDGIKKIHSGLLRFARKKSKQCDGDDAFIATVQDVQANIQKWTDEETEQHANTLLTLAEDLPDTEEKQKLQRYIADIPLFKSEPTEVVAEALQAIVSLYQSMNTDAITDVMETQMDGQPNSACTGKEDCTCAECAAKRAQVKDGSVNVTPAPAQPVQQNDTLPPAAPAATPAAAGAQDPAAAHESVEITLMKEVSAKLDKLISCLAPKEPAAPAQAAPEPPKTTDGAQSMTEAKTGDAMPVFTQTLATVQAGDSLDDLFMKMKERN